MAERFELDPVVTVGEGDRAVPTTRHPIRFSATPVGYALPPPELDEHGEEIRKWLGDKARNSVGDECLSIPTALGASVPRQDHVCSARTSPRTSWVRSGSASWRSGSPPSAGRRTGETRVFEAVLAALADHGFTPTAIVTRLTYLSAPDSVQGALAAGLLGGGSRFLGVTEDCGRFLHEQLTAAPSCRSTTPAGTRSRWTS